jgi:hypothetical protein
VLLRWNELMPTVVRMRITRTMWRYDGATCLERIYIAGVGEVGPQMIKLCPPCCPRVNSVVPHALVTKDVWYYIAGSKYTVTGIYWHTDGLLADLGRRVGVP